MKWISLASVVFSSLTLSTIATAQPEIVRGIKGHVAGDVIALQTDKEVVAWCDFGKQIVLTQNNVLCVYNGKSER
jgi:hypothetical protein